jgi:tetratricopeptide (TPR) repeat protein
MTTGVFENGGRSAGREAEIWQTDPGTLRDVVVDRAAMKARLGVYPSVERVWALSLLGRSEQAVVEGQLLLAGSRERFRPLLVLAHARWYQDHWQEAALLQEEALRLARSPAREALVRYEIGRRFFDEGRYREAAAEFDWACDLYRTAGHKRLARVCRQALELTRRILASAKLGEQDGLTPLIRAASALKADPVDQPRREGRLTAEDRARRQQQHHYLVGAQGPCRGCCRESGARLLCLQQRPLGSGPAV